MKHVPEPWELSPSGQFVRKDTKGDGHLIICEVNRNWHTSKETQIANAQRIVACVNAMEGIENPQLLRKYWDEQMFNEVKSNYVQTALLSKDELQKLGEQYRNQDETPYIETTTGEKVHQKHTGAASEYIGLTVKREDTKSIDDRIVIIFDEYAQKMQDKIDHYFSVYADKANRYDFIKKLILEILERVEKSPVTLQENGAIYNALKKVIQ